MHVVANATLYPIAESWDNNALDRSRYSVIYSYVVASPKHIQTLSSRLRLGQLFPLSCRGNLLKRSNATSNNRRVCSHVNIFSASQTNQSESSEGCYGSIFGSGCFLDRGPHSADVFPAEVYWNVSKQRGNRIDPVSIPHFRCCLLPRFYPCEMAISGWRPVILARNRLIHFLLHDTFLACPLPRVNRYAFDETSGLSRKTDAKNTV